MIRISKQAIKRLKESNQGSQKNVFRVLISGIG
jgi:Fe-S cluster assembly iron-binding protein IscA